MKQKNFFFRFLLSMLIVSLISVGVNAQILTFEFDAGGSLTSNTNSANITSSTISYTTATLTSTLAPPNGFTVSNWVNGATPDTNEYFQFTITPVTNGSFNVTTMVFNYARATNGPQTIAIRNSLDNYATNLATATVTNNGTTVQVFTVNINQTSSSSAVTYRIYGYLGAGNNTGSGGFSGTGNDIIVNGTATSANFSGSAVISRSGRSSICLGDSSSIAFNITGGTAPYTVQTIDNLGLLRTFSGVQSNTPIYVYPQESKTYSFNSITDNNGQSLLAANFSGSAEITVTSSPVVTNTGTYSRTLSHNDGLTLIYADGSLCKSWVKIQDSLGGAVLGSTTCVATLLENLPINTTSRRFLSRRVDITPTTNGASIVTLFYSQADFNAYNAGSQYQVKLPTSSTDTANVNSELIILRTVNSTATDSLTSFTPSSVVWNQSNSHWEVTFYINDGILTGKYYLSTPFNSTKMVTGLTHSVAPVVSGQTYATATIDWNDIVGVTQYRIRIRPLNGSWNSHTVTGSQRISTLAFNTTYEVQVRVYEGTTTQGEYCNSYTFTTPAQPGNLPNCLPPVSSVTLNSPTSVTISWVSTSFGANYIVEMRALNGLVWGGTSTVGNSVSFNALTPGAAYVYRIRTTCVPGNTINGTSAFSSIDTFTMASISPCGVVGNLTTVSTTAYSGTVSWSSVPFATSYQVQMRLKNTATWGGTSTLATSITFNSLSSLSNYEYRVRAYCNNSPALTSTNTGLFSSVAEFNTTSAPALGACLPPTNILATPTANSVTITWDSASNASGYFINIKQANAASWGGTVVSGLSRTFNSLSPSTNYQIRIRTSCTPGTTTSNNSIFSDTVLFATTALANKAIFGTDEMPSYNVYPNPTRDNLHIDFTSSSTEAVRIEVRDMTGRLIQTQRIDPMVGANSFDVDLKSAADGLYLIHIYQGSALQFMNKIQKTH